MTGARRQFNQPDGRVVHVRTHRKADQRRLLLFGYKPHEGAPAPGGLDGAGPGAELRWHPLLAEWSIYAAHRQNRTFMPAAADDPLAPTRTGAALTEIEFDDFELAVFQNRFAALHPDAAAPSASPAGCVAGVARGDCEVVVYTPELSGNLATLSQARRRLLLSAWIDRYWEHFARGAEFVLPFESRGREVGVTLDHPHGQIYAFPFVPDVQKRMASGFDAGFSVADHLESWRNDYWIEAAGPVVAFVPPFMRFPYEVWIASREKVSGPWDFNAEAFDAYAHLLGRVTARYDAFFNRPAATLMSLHAAPGGREGPFEFTTQFYSLLRAPDRIKYLASVEQSTNVFTVDVMPEVAAQQLRGAL